MSKASERAQIDEKVLRHLRALTGSTAWAMRGAVSEDRETISKALQRLKRKGLVECGGAYWRVHTESSEG
jgi:predicted transcriptional regulator